jgi:hypothetical protein
MTEEELENILTEKGVMFKYDGILNLWLVFIDDMTLYLSPSQLEELNSIDLVVVLTKQAIGTLQSGRLSKEILYH